MRTLEISQHKVHKYPPKHPLFTRLMKQTSQYASAKPGFNVHQPDPTILLRQVYVPHSRHGEAEPQ